jgi:hypothetical protein
MKYAWTNLQLPAGTTVREVSIEESLEVLRGSWAPGLPTSVLPKRVQERLDRGEQVDLSELVAVPTAVPHEQ